jgi:hypothetical protein
MAGDEPEAGATRDAGGSAVQGILPPVWAKVLDTIFHVPSIRARDRKST